MIRSLLIPALCIPMLASVLVGCADPYGDAKKADTIEAWEGYLATGPTGSNESMAMKRLEELLISRADESHSIADYDAVLTKFPKSTKKKKMQEGRANAAFAAAEADGSLEGWKKFLAENDFADSALKKRATAMVDVAAFAAALTIAAPTVAEVNLANDAKGAKDGWGFTSAVTNNGAVALEYANLELQFLGADGKKLKAVSYPIASRTGPGGMPIEAALMPPLAPAETRTWSYTTGEVPEGWAEGKAVKLVLVGARAVPAAPEAAPK